MKPELGADASLEERDAAAKETYNQEGKVACPGCARSFKDEATMQKHMKGCAAASCHTGPTEPAPTRGGSAATLSPIQGRTSPTPKGSGGEPAPKGPPSLCCYICGKQCLASSFAIHEKACIRAWEDAESHKPPRERKPLPSKPELGEGASLEEQNAAAQEAYNQEGKSRCPGCSRGFKDEATLVKHMKGCAAAAGASPAPPPSAGPAQADSPKSRGSPAKKGPTSVCCYICGKQCLVSSFSIHEQACIKKWEETEAKKPQQDRKPLPTKPELGEGASLEEYNAAAQEAYNTEAKALCPKCGRGFKDEGTLAKHEKGCKGGAR